MGGNDGGEREEVIVYRVDWSSCKEVSMPGAE